MVGFIIPFKSKLKSRNWNKDNFLLKQTVHSISNQKNSDFRIYVVYTDFPDLNYLQEKIEYIKFPFPFLTVNQITDYEHFLSKHFSDKIGEFMFDQGKRILWGCSFAIKDGCDYVMSVDADDLISNKIVGFICKNKTEKFGWFVNKGYILKENRSFLIEVNKNMNHINGSTNIVNINLIPKVNFDSTDLAEFTFFSSHGFLSDRIKYAYKEPLKPLPFYALIYFVHDDNWSSIGLSLKKNKLKTFLKYLLRGKILSDSIKQEFGLKNKNLE